MDQLTRLNLIDKARYIYGFVNILKSDIGILRNEINDSNDDKIRIMISSTNETLQMLVTLVDEFNNILDMSKIE